MTPRQGQRIIVGISGASGTLYGIRLLEALRALGVETHLIVTKAAAMTLQYESEMKLADIQALASHNHPIGNIGASIASGSFRTTGMIVAPCSVKTMSEIATGVTSNLLSRAADVVLKERRRLVLMVRETPLHIGHLRTMLALAEMGAVIAPPVPALYARPETIDDLVRHSIARVLDLFDLDTPGTHRWGDATAHRNQAKG